jgi:hypothetical protein
MDIYYARPTTFYDLIEPFSDEVQEIARHLRALIFEVFPQTREEICGDTRAANAVYSNGDTGDLISGIHPCEDHCKLYVHFLGDNKTPGVSLDNDSQNVRQTHIYTLEDVADLNIKQMLRTARANSHPAG